jgi:hypothetical protein
MRTRSFAFLLVTFALAGCAAQSGQDVEETDTPESVLADEAALSTAGKALVGGYEPSDAALYPRFELRSDGTYSWDTGIRCITTPCPSGDAGRWQLYRGSAGAQYVYTVSRPAPRTAPIERWFRVRASSPIQLVGVFGTKGSFTKDEPVRVGCEAIRCAQGFFCDASGPTAQCLPYDTCATRAPVCSVSTHCEDLEIDCIKAPCAPTAPACVPNR